MHNSSQTPSIQKLKGLFWGVPIGIAIYIVIDIVLQYLEPLFNPISIAESDLATGPFGYLMDINFDIRGLLSLCFMYAFWKILNLKEHKAIQHGFWLLGVWTVGSFLLAVFPTDFSGISVILVLFYGFFLR